MSDADTPTRIRKLESELDNVKNLYRQLAERVLKLELAISVLDKDGTVTDRHTESL